MVQDLLHPLQGLCKGFILGGRYLKVQGMGPVFLVGYTSGYMQTNFNFSLILLSKSYLLGPLNLQVRLRLQG